MRDLKQYVRECMNELSSIGITCGNIVELEANSRAKSRWGQCETVVYNKDWSKKCYKISISVLHLDERNSEEGLKNTIIHELLHTCKNCHGHKGEWKRLAEKVRRELGYNIKRCSTADEMGINVGFNETDETYNNKSSKKKSANPPKYLIVCTHCGYTYPRYKKSAVVQHPERYRCGRCGGKLKLS